MPTNPVDFDVIEPIQSRFSPYLFADKPVSTDDLRACLEAARWAASSYNDQPWSWIVARKQDTKAFDEMVAVLAAPNQDWAKNADVLMIGVTRNHFRQNQKPNRVALHDLGAAAALMALQATKLGLQIHQMAGVDQDAAAETYDVPEGHSVQTAIAIGHPMVDPPSQEQQALRAREVASRSRLSLREQVFGGKWGTAADFVQ